VEPKTPQIKSKRSSNQEQKVLKPIAKSPQIKSKKVLKSRAKNKIILAPPFPKVEKVDFLSKLIS
jgi:hypothetical protein